MKLDAVLIMWQDVVRVRGPFACRPPLGIRAMQSQQLPPIQPAGGNMLQFELVNDKKRKGLGRAMAMSAAVQALIISLLILIPLLTIKPLSVTAFADKLLTPPPPPPAPPHVKVFTEDRKEKPREERKIDDKFTSPPEIPKFIPIPGVPEIPRGDKSGVEGGNPEGVPTGTGRKIFPFPFPGPDEAAPPPPPPPPLPPPAPPSRIRVGGNVAAASLITQVKPVYPPLAKQARIQGVVVLEAEIDREGNITMLRVISGHPLLVPAALNAVREWKYRPTLLNGEPVPVLTTITVNFTFAQ